MAIHIVYLSHGGKKYYDQTRFSVLSLLHLLLKQQRQDVKIMVYTDAPDSVPAHPLVRTETLSRTQLQAYRGQFDYVHRIKLEVMLKAARELGTAVLYVDCDTRWLRVPDELFARLEEGKASCMHVNEGVFGPGFFPDYLAAVDKHGAELRKMGVADVRGLAMWNAGVVGASADMVPFFETALRVNDFLLPRVEARNWTEQLAWSLVACDGREPLALGDALHHYWNYSYEAPLYLAEVFAGMEPGWDVARQAEYCGEFAWDESRLKTIQADPEHKRQRRRNKLRNSISKRKVDWRILIARLRGALPSAD